MNKTYSVGARLRALRTERKLTQRELAERAGISANAISLIERDENSPSVSTLQSLATALKVKMTYFFTEQSPKEVVFKRAGDRPTVDGAGLQIEALGQRLKQQELEPLFLHLDPKSNGHRSVVHSGQEFVYCLEGNIEFVVDGDAYRMEKGDCLLFDGQLPHFWHNLSDAPSELLIIMQSGNAHADTVNYHFPELGSLKFLN